MTTAAAQAIPVILPRRKNQVRQADFAGGPAVPVAEGRDSSRCEDAVCLSLMAGAAVVAVGGLAWAGHVVFSEAARVGLQNAFQSMIGVAF